MPSLRSKPISVNIRFVSYFSQNKNYTYIHWTIGKPSLIYSSLNYLQNYLSDYCLRINKYTIITFTNIASYNNEEVIVKDGKAKSRKTLLFSKQKAASILSVLQEKVPELEEKNATFLTKIENGGVKDDENKAIGGLSRAILEEIHNNPGISVIKLAEILKEKTSLRTLERRLKELKDADKIKYEGSDKKGGYYIV